LEPCFVLARCFVNWNEEKGREVFVKLCGLSYCGWFCRLGWCLVWLNFKYNKGLIFTRQIFLRMHETSCYKVTYCSVAKPLRLAELTFQNQTGSKTVSPLSDRLLIHCTVNLACNMLQFPHVFKSQEEVVKLARRIVLKLTGCTGTVGVCRLP
jgi:hypothetical protein